MAELSVFALGGIPLESMIAFFVILILFVIGGRMTFKKDPKLGFIFALLLVTGIAFKGPELWASLSNFIFRFFAIAGPTIGLLVFGAAIAMGIRQAAAKSNKEEYYPESGWIFFLVFAGVVIAFIAAGGIDLINLNLSIPRIGPGVIQLVGLVGITILVGAAIYTSATSEGKLKERRKAHHKRKASEDYLATH